jgi:hypothetical protein
MSASAERIAKILTILARSFQLQVQPFHLTSTLNSTVICSDYSSILILSSRKLNAALTGPIDRPTSRLPPCINSSILPRNSNTMPPKGASTLVAPARLPALSHIKVRRPDKNTANPCIGIMTNMLSTTSLTLNLQFTEAGEGDADCDCSRLLGFCRRFDTRMRRAGAAAESLYG